MFRRANGDSKAVTNGRIGKPTDENSLLPKLFLPNGSGFRTARRGNEEEVGGAWRYLKAKLRQRASELVSFPDNGLKVFAVVGKVIQGSESGDLGQSVDVVAVANFVKRGNERLRTNEVADSLETQRVGFGECARNDDVAEFRREGNGVFFGKVNIGFVEDDRAASGRAQTAQRSSAIRASAGSVRRSDEAKRRIGTPAGLLKPRQGGDAKRFGERHFVGLGCVNGSERSIKRVTGREVLNHLPIGIFPGLFCDGFDKGPGGQRQEFV